MIDIPKSLSGMRTVSTFLRVGTSPEGMRTVLNRAHGDTLATEDHASHALAGGIARRGHQCGQVWGATLAAGAQAYQRHGAGPAAQAVAIAAGQRIVESFGGRYGSIDCREVTGVEFPQKKAMLPYRLKSGVKCLRVAAEFAPVAYAELDTVLREEPTDVPEPPVSCAAVLAEKIDASDLRTTMASGFAGGVGLSGHGCGALGAAVWLLDIEDRERSADKVGYQNPRFETLIERFERATGGVFECERIVGRRFTSVADHAAYLRAGGCAAIIEALAEPIDVEQAAVNNS